MNRFQIENLYEVNGLENYKLKNTEDLLKCHGINYRVDGYNRLDDISKSIYEKFIVKFFNGWGLESRAELVPKGIYCVEDETLLVKENPEDEDYIISGGIIYAIDRSGLKSVLHTWTDEEYKDFEVIEKETSTYLRFEYELDGRKEWLHVIEQGEEWY